MVVDNYQGLVFELDKGSALDIGSLKVDGVEIAPGKAVPDDGDPRILHAVGGFLFTCGPDHIRHPEPLGGTSVGKYPLHGSMAGTKPADIVERSSGDLLEIQARVTVPLAQGGQADVSRTWEVDRSTGEVTLRDQVKNTGSTAFPPMLMYHMNIGAHLFDGNTGLDGRSFEGGRIGWIFGEGDGHVFCVPAASDEDDRARIKLGPIRAVGGKSLHVWFSTATLPHLQMWRNQAAPAHVLGIEPVSHPWKGRDELQSLGLMDMLQPGETRDYALGFAFR
ncbi:DUF4432 family protein [Rhizobium sp. KVB221]|uniref:DUF4432 family protein n=1 Tax=Rhizobium setariae TaxID=2801340 RepID=A0A936YUZ4_9HYPH|nr:DUF4432 family protein [Rhizobium setariae]MBL0375304.1 DUF4432 family protein [Rhizobium setariae]